MSELISQSAFKVIEGRPVTSSRIVAEYFGKKHSDVVRAIQTIITQKPDLQASRNFAQWSEDVEIGSGAKRTVVCFWLDRKGFSILAMGFTGAKALDFKCAFYDEFERMEKQLHSPCPIATLTPAQQLQLREAVAKRAQTATAHYHTIYRALYARFQVPRYTEILAKDFDAAIDFIRSVDLRVPMCTPAKKEASQACPMCGLRPVPQGSVILHPDECRALLTFIYYVRYLFRGCLLKFADTLIAFNAPEAGRFYEAVTASTYVTIERALARRGYTMSQNGISLPQPQEPKQIAC